MMAIVRGCCFPDELWFDVPNHVWYALAPDNLLRLGITPVGVTLAREVLLFTPKRVGASFGKGRSVATVESAKWVGSVRAGFAGTIVAVNEDLVKRARPVNHDCYGAGWMMLVQADEPQWSEGLVTGPAVAPSYEAWMEDKAFPGCEG